MTKQVKIYHNPPLFKEPGNAEPAERKRRGARSGALP
ncbi:Uncharacterised protein [Escherichia coli]|nr:Uncharacterised protein [Escherichia coli]